MPIRKRPSRSLVPRLPGVSFLAYLPQLLVKSKYATLYHSHASDYTFYHTSSRNENSPFWMCITWWWVRIPLHIIRYVPVFALYHYTPTSYMIGYCVFSSKNPQRHDKIIQHRDVNLMLKRIFHRTWYWTKKYWTSSLTTLAFILAVILAFSPNAFRANTQCISQRLYEK